MANRLTRRGLIKAVMGLPLLMALGPARYKPLLLPTYKAHAEYQANRFMLGTAFTEASNATGTAYLGHLRLDDLHGGVRAQNT
mgnify:CR=1 FL=1